MSVRVLTIVWDASPSQGAELLVLLALADQAGDDGVTWVEIPRIARKTRLSERHVIRMIGALEKEGRVEKRKAQRGRRRVSVYRVLGPGLRPVDYDRLPFDLDRPFDPRYDKVSHDKVSGAQARRHDTGGTDDMTPRAGAAKEEPSLNRPTSSGRGRRRGPGDEIWDALTTLFGEATTESAKSKRGKLVRSLRAAGATGEEVLARAKRYPEVMPPNTILTETALEAHWDRCVPRSSRKVAVCEECGISEGAGHSADCSRAGVVA